VAAAEVMDRASLRSVENDTGIPSYLKTLSATTTALLVETRAYTTEELQNNINKIIRSLEGIETERPLEFTEKEDEYTKLWNIRKGLFPAVGAVRTIGTTVIIEDVAFPIKSLAEATLELQSLFAKYRYDNGIIFGHALAGNLHFVFTQDFSTTEEVERYRQFMDDVCVMVVDKYDGSLKGEHGTGRNMAPYVEMEWGRDAYDLMKEIKEIFDPKNLLNPGVIINHNPLVHIENLKPLPETNPIVDKCTECGFCETSCPSKGLTLTPRQRIVIQREISRLRSTSENAVRLRQIENDYIYQGEQTCAVDGMCATTCPVAINTGELTKTLRHANTRNKRTQIGANWIAGNFDRVAGILRTGLKISHSVHKRVGSQSLERLSRLARRISGNRLPSWNRYMPRGVAAPMKNPDHHSTSLKVVYFPSCISRTMGPAKGDPDNEPLYEVTVRVLSRAGYDVIYPKNMDRLCCGTPFESKGLREQADMKATELEDALMIATSGGKLPVLCDISPCLYRIRQAMNPALILYEPVEFIHDLLMDKLTFSQLPGTVAIHNTCSSIKMELTDKFRSIAQACAQKVIVPERVGCCGFAGDRGFSYPELNESALNELKAAVSEKCTSGYSNSRTCEIGLSLHSGLYYKSILYLVDRCTRPIEKKESNHSS
jgi:D-lactate dehydrogenase